ncbi:MAG: cytidine deaminase [Peptococcaceae bacterium]|nr:cytidine deaminase [Peptococcaceae bacterium]
MIYEKDDVDFSALLAAAARARKRAYAPYSGYQVGAALLAEDGRVFTGCNVESAAYSPTNCAERTAVFKAVSEGCLRFKALAVAGGHRDKELGELDYFTPCGVCRQVLREFCSEDFPVAIAGPGEDYKVLSLGELLPFGFGPETVPDARKD